MAIVAVNITQHQHQHQQQGMTLLEVLVSAAITLITLVGVVSLYLAGTQLALKQHQQLLLAHGLNDAMQLISSELLRSGYSNQSRPYRLSGAEQVIVADASASTPSISMIYQQSDHQWQMATFRYKPSIDVLQYCYKSVAFSDDEVPFMEADWACSAGAVRSLVDQSVVKIRDFSFTQTEFDREGGNFITLELTMKGQLTAAPQFTKTLHNQLTIRNSY
ncbi:MAG: prepilin-type N-terminal cleavage/methylation domain-containing protein [Aliivibrio sp.]|uniref:PilW family protein n=1 Tax=Aliivibrio sp. TaxID=1872443 RepID=UPI001A5D89C2|nr:prepilin-type N-terminal cleavage/methylation domain-containing protein [Aliivibrio sp.]